MYEDYIMIKHILKIRFQKAIMSKKVKSAYNELAPRIKSTQLKSHGYKFEVTVPSHLNKKDAEKALKLIKLEYGLPKQFLVNWELQTNENKHTPVTPKPS